MKITDFTSANEFLGVRSARTIRGKRSTEVRRMPLGEIAVYYHATPVVTYWPSGRFVLRSGGHRTLTTKVRMNQHTNARVFQRNFTWYVYLDGRTINFVDGMSLGNVKVHDYRHTMSLFS